MLRLLTGCVLLVLLSTSHAGETSSREAMTKILDRAAALQEDEDFREHLAGQRQAVRSIAPPAPPGIVGPTPPEANRRAPRSEIVSADRSPARQWSETHRQPLLILVSFSMPEAEIRDLAEQGARVGASLILRGLVNGSFPATQERIAHFADIPGASFQVDPTLFRRFGVQSVPTFVLPLETLEACNDAGCPVPRHVKIAGDAGLDHVLREIRREAVDPVARAVAAEMATRMAGSP